jgi:hypothetical protein
LEPTYYHATAVVHVTHLLLLRWHAVMASFVLSGTPACLQVCSALQPRRLYLELPWIPTLHLAGNDTITEPASDGRLLALGRA